MKKWIGLLLMGTAVLHTAVGLLVFGGILADIGRAGIWNAIDPHYDRATAVWFLLFGFILFLLGMLVQWVEQQTGTLPHSLGWGLLLIGVMGVVLMPVSGFWLIFPQAYWVLRPSPTQQPNPA